MFGLFKTKKIRGIIGFLGLEDWWTNILSEYDRNEILNNYTEFGTRCIEKGDIKAVKKVLLEENICSSNNTILKFARGLISFRKITIEDSLLIKISELIENEANKVNIDKFSVHLGYGLLGAEYYTLRESENCYERAKYYFLKQIEISKEAKQSWIEEEKKLGIKVKDIIIPSHKGFTQMAIIYDREKKYKEALELCERAKKECWNGDWDKRILRLQKKAMKK